MLPNASITKKKIEETKDGLFSGFSKSESAAVTVIIALLLLGFIFTIISVVRLGYVPEWKEEAEQDYMNEIWDDMVGVKVRIDILSGFMESGNYLPNNYSATVPFNLGGGKIPVFEPSKSDGKLEVNKDNCNMSIILYNSTNQSTILETICGGISCYTENSQYPDDVFRYENGALIVSDGKSSVMKQPPAFSINETSTDNYTVTIRGVQLLGKADSISSNTIIPLQLTGWNTTTYNNSENNRSVNNSSENNGTSITSFKLTINTKYPAAWFSYLKETAEKAGLNKKDYELNTDYELKKEDKKEYFNVYFNFTGGKNLDRLYINTSAIRVDLGIKSNADS